MTVLKFDMVQTLAVAAVVLFIGNWIKDRSGILKKYYIPAPVVGGLLASALILAGKQAGVFHPAFDTTLQGLFMTAFFTTVGFMASLKLLVQGGIGVLMMLLAATVLVVAQDSIGCLLAPLFGLDPKFGLVVGSVPLTGGHGTVGAFGRTIEELGVAGAQTAGFAAATYGLVAGCLLGGPIGRLLLDRHRIQPVDDRAHADVVDMEPASSVVSTDARDDPFSARNLINAAVCISLSMGVGSLIGPLVKEHTLWLMKGGLSLPVYIGPMLVAALLRNLADMASRRIPMTAIDAVGSVCLSIFLSMAMMTMKLWELIDLAMPLVTILLIQTAFAAAFVYFATYAVMKQKFIGTPYDAAVICTGHCGFGLGATPTAMANMTAFCEANGFSTKAFFIVPLIGTLFIDFINAAVITTFINMFS